MNEPLMYGDFSVGDGAACDGKERVGTITYHRDLYQGTDEWLEARRGLLTASEMKLIITPTLKIADNDKSRSHLNELLAQRISGYVEPSYISDDMLRGMDDEAVARDIYAKHFAPVEQVGFVTNHKWGFILGYSPDGLIGDDGLIEIKSRRQKFQVGTILDGKIPDDYAIQIQTGLLVTGRAWCDYVSYCGGLPMAVVRAYPDATVQAAIIEAATKFEDRLAEKTALYLETIKNPRFIPTVRKVEQEMHV